MPSDKITNATTKNRVIRERDDLWLQFLFRECRLEINSYEDCPTEETVMNTAQDIRVILVLLSLLADVYEPLKRCRDDAKRIYDELVKLDEQAYRKRLNELKRSK